MHRLLNGLALVFLMRRHTGSGLVVLVLPCLSEVIWDGMQGITIFAQLCILVCLLQMFDITP